MNTNLNDIHAFIIAVQSESFAKAAYKLHVTPSAVEKAISRLEDRLSIRLFNRTTRNRHLTDEGMFYYEQCQKAMEKLENEEKLLDRGKLVVQGKLRVSMPVLFGQLCVAPLLWELAKEHNELDLELSFTDRKIDLIDEGFDLAIRNGSLPDTHDLVARKLGQHKMTLCAATEYLGRVGYPNTLMELLQHNILANTHQKTILPQNILNHAPKDKSFRVRFVMDDLKAILDAALVGMGVAWLPYWLVREYLVSGQLTELLPELSQRNYPIHALWASNPYLPLKIRLAVDKLVQKLPARLSVIESN